ncbi:hypothetical protein DNTS_009624, partial [Danionella cerebrum]
TALCHPASLTPPMLPWVSKSPPSPFLSLQTLPASLKPSKHSDLLEDGWDTHSLPYTSALSLPITCAAVKETKTEGASKQVFMGASDASNFFKRRNRRSPKTYDEYYAEQRVQMAANERRREHLEEQSTEYENYLEEERDEQYERSRERNEQWREFNYDGQYPRYPHHRPYF